MLDAIEEQRAIGEAGQRVVERAMAKLLFQELAFGGAAKRASCVLAQLTCTTFLDAAEATRVIDATQEADHRLVAAVVEGETQAGAVRRDDRPAMLPIDGRVTVKDSPHQLRRGCRSEGLLVDEEHVAVRAAPPEEGR